MTTNNGNYLPKHTITALVEDRPGVLNRISSMFRRRGFNIASLAVGHSEEPGRSRMTFVVEGDDRVVEQVTKHLHKLIDVIKVTEINDDNVISRELALVKVKADAQSRSEIIQIVDIFKAKIVGVAPDALIVEVTGDVDKLESLLGLLKPFGVSEVMRTGTIVMERWTGSMHGDNGGRPRKQKSATHLANIWGEPSSV